MLHNSATTNLGLQQHRGATPHLRVKQSTQQLCPRLQLLYPKYALGPNPSGTSCPSYINSGSSVLAFRTLRCTTPSREYRPLDCLQALAKQLSSNSNSRFNKIAPEPSMGGPPSRTKCTQAFLFEKSQNPHPLYVPHWCSPTGAQCFPNRYF